MSRFREDYIEDDSVLSIFTLLDGAVKSIPPSFYNQVEFLIKFDNDDKVAKARVNELSKYPFQIKSFFYNRWEGLATANYHLSFLFLYRDITSNFIGMVGDDAVFLEEATTCLFDTLQAQVNNKYAIISSTEHELNTDYQTNQNNWILSVDDYPIVSSKIIEISSGYGFQANVNNWVSLLQNILYYKYNVNLNHRIIKYAARDNRQVKHFANDKEYFNKEFFISNERYCTNPYYFTLVEQQARNIYLNMKEEGLL